MLFDDETDDETMDTENEPEQDLLMQNRFIEEHQYQMMRDNSEQQLHSNNFQHNSAQKQNLNKEHIAPYESAEGYHTKDSKDFSFAKRIGSVMVSKHHQRDMLDSQ